MWLADTKLDGFPFGGVAIGNPPYPYTLDPVLREPDANVEPIPDAKGMFDPEL